MAANSNSNRSREWFMLAAQRERLAWKGFGLKRTACGQADHAIDATGLICPEPLMILRNKVREMARGETVSVVATDPSTVRDFTNFCRFMQHDLAESRRDGDRYRFVIRKG